MAEEDPNLAEALRLSLLNIGKASESETNTSNNDDSGYDYTDAFDIDTFLQTNVPNTNNRCYANSTSQLVRMIPEFFEGLAPYDGTEPFGALEFYQFMHRLLHITNPTNFSETYQENIERLLDRLDIGGGQHDNSDFFLKMIGDGATDITLPQLPPPMQEKLNAYMVQQAEIAAADNMDEDIRNWTAAQLAENISNIRKYSLRRTGGGPGPFWSRLKPLIEITTNIKYTLRVSGDCVASVSEKIGDDTSLLRLDVAEATNGASIQHFFQPIQITRSVFSNFITEIINKPGCNKFVKDWIKNRREQEELEKRITDTSIEIRSRASEQAIMHPEQRRIQTAITAALMELRARADFINPLEHDTDTYLKEFSADGVTYTNRESEEGKRYITFLIQNKLKLEDAKKHLMTFPEFSAKHKHKRKVLQSLRELRDNVRVKTKKSDLEPDDFKALYALTNIPDYETVMRPLRALEEAASAKLKHEMTQELKIMSSNKYFIAYLSYFDLKRGGGLTDKRLVNLLAPITLHLVDDTTKMYQPICFVIHSGHTMNSGHYVTASYIDEKAGWYLFDDMKYPHAAIPLDVRTLSSELVKSSNQPTFILYRQVVGGGGGPTKKGGAWKTRRFIRNRKAKTRSRK